MLINQLGRVIKDTKKTTGLFLSVKTELFQKFNPKVKRLLQHLLIIFEW